MPDFNDTAVASGAIASFNNGADDVPLSSVIAHIAPTLTGKNAVNMVQSGKNLLDMTIYDGGSYNPAVGTAIALSLSASQFTKTSNAYSIDTTTSWKTFSVRMPVKSGVTYYRKFTMSASGTNLGSSEYYLDADNKVIGSVSNNTDNPHTKNGTLSIPSGAVWFVITFTNRSTATNTLTFTEPQIEVGSTATAYEAYTAPTTYTASLGRTIYGGTADIVNGIGTNSYDKGSMSSTYLSGLNSNYIGYELSTAYFGGHPSVWVRNWNYSRAKERQSGGIGCVCNYFPISMHNTNIFSAQYRIYFDVNGKNISSVADFIAFVQNLEANNESLDIVYELNDTYTTDFTFTPITPTPETALGVNNFWSEQGDSEVTYYKDGYGFTSVTVHKETPEGEPVEETRKLHRIIYEGQVDVISGTGLIYRGESGTQYDPPEQISFTPIEVSTDEGENTLFADEGDSAIIYRKEIT